jgi:hypothetical protein
MILIPEGAGPGFGNTVRMSGRAQSWLVPEAVVPPHIRARHEGGDAEERELFYVALTRARDAVYLSCLQRRNNRVQATPYLVEVAGDRSADSTVLPMPPRPAEQGRDDLPPREVSSSDLAAFDECGHRFRLARCSVLSRRWPSSWATAGPSTMCCGTCRRIPKAEVTFPTATRWPTCLNESSTGLSPTRPPSSACIARRGAW